MSDDRKQRTGCAMPVATTDVHVDTYASATTSLVIERSGPDPAPYSCSRCVELTQKIGRLNEQLNLTCAVMDAQDRLIECIRDDIKQDRLLTHIRDGIKQA